MFGRDLPGMMTAVAVPVEAVTVVVPSSSDDVSTKTVVVAVGTVVRTVTVVVGSGMEKAGRVSVVVTPLETRTVTDWARTRPARRAAAVTERIVKGFAYWKREQSGQRPSQESSKRTS